MEPNGLAQNIASSTQNSSTQNNSMQNTGDADAIRKEMEENKEREKRLHADKLDKMLGNISNNMKKEEEDIRDDGRRHVDMKSTLTTLQQQLKELLSN